MTMLCQKRVSATVAENDLEIRHEWRPESYLLAAATDPRKIQFVGFRAVANSR